MHECQAEQDFPSNCSSGLLWGRLGLCLRSLTEQGAFLFFSLSSLLGSGSMEEGEVTWFKCGEDKSQALEKIWRKQIGIRNLGARDKWDRIWKGLESWWGEIGWENRPGQEAIGMGSLIKGEARGMGHETCVGARRLRLGWCVYIKKFRTCWAYWHE